MIEWKEPFSLLESIEGRYEQKPECLIITFNYLAKVDT